MTTNQIEYAKLLETRRNNIATLEETSKHNRATENFSLSSLQETVTHNRNTESLGSQTLNETVRHNKAGESINLANLQETTRHNIATEQYSLSNLQETAKHNRETENQGRIGLSLRGAELQESQRSNRANEAIKQTTNAINQWKANIDSFAQAEVARHNMTTEELTQWFNENKVKNELQSIQNTFLTGVRNADLQDKQVKSNVNAANANINKAIAEINNLSTTSNLNKARTAKEYVGIISTALEDAFGALKLLKVLK